MAYARVVINDAALQSLLKSPGGAVVMGMSRIGRLVSNEAKRRCPVDEGRLRASIVSTTTVNGSVVTTRIGTPVEYALYVHNGTGIYGASGTVIRPVTASVLRFTPKKGPVVYSRYVLGQKGNPFLTDALRAVLTPLGWNITYRHPTGGPRG